jgi:hypothetical protein
VSLALSGALVIVWAWVRLVVFDTTLFPLTYVPLTGLHLVARLGRALGMAAVYAALHLTQLVWMPPDSTLGLTTGGKTDRTS